MICIRPDICFFVELVKYFQNNPEHSHWKASKSITRYLRGTTNYMPYIKEEIRVCIATRMSIGKTI